MTDDEIAEAAWEAFCEAHPHEAHETWPDRFWQYFHKKCPMIPRAKMKQMLKETENYEPTHVPENKPE